MVWVTPSLPTNPPRTLPSVWVCSLSSRAKDSLPEHGTPAVTQLSLEAIFQSTNSHSWPNCGKKELGLPTTVSPRYRGGPPPRQGSGGQRRENCTWHFSQGVLEARTQRRVTGAGTRPWTLTEVAVILKSGKSLSYQPMFGVLFVFLQ